MREVIDLLLHLLRVLGGVKGVGDVRGVKAIRGLRVVRVIRGIRVARIIRGRVITSSTCVYTCKDKLSEIGVVGVDRKGKASSL